MAGELKVNNAEIEPKIEFTNKETDLEELDKNGEGAIQEICVFDCHVVVLH